MKKNIRKNIKNYSKNIIKILTKKIEFLYRNYYITYIF